MIGNYIYFEDKDLERKLDNRLGILAFSLANYLYTPSFNEKGDYLPFEFGNVSVVIDLFRPMIFQVIFEGKSAHFSLGDGRLISSNIQLTENEMQRIRFFYLKKKEEMLEIQNLSDSSQTSHAL